MSEKNEIGIQDKKQLLKSIFQISHKDSNKLNPIIKDSTNIPHLILYLKDNKNNITEKFEIIYFLFQSFKENNQILPLFMRKNKTNTINLYEPLIDLYLSKDGYINEYKSLILELIKMIRNRITLTKEPIEYLYQKLSYFFENKETKEKERLNENQILKYLYLFKLFYTGGTNENIFVKNSFPLNSNNQIENIKEIKNYLYFNGIRSCISLALNKNSINPNTDYPTLQYGLSFIIWLYIDEKLIKLYQENNYNLEIKLVVINISGEQIKLVLKDLFTLQISFNDNEVKNIQTTLIKVNDWNNICFSIL